MSWGEGVALPAEGFVQDNFMRLLAGWVGVLRSGPALEANMGVGICMSHVPFRTAYYADLKIVSLCHGTVFA